MRGLGNFPKRQHSYTREDSIIEILYRGKGFRGGAGLQIGSSQIEREKVPPPSLLFGGPKKKRTPLKGKRASFIGNRVPVTTTRYFHKGTVDP